MRGRSSIVTCVFNVALSLSSVSGGVVHAVDDVSEFSFRLVSGSVPFDGSHIPPLSGWVRG